MIRLFEHATDHLANVCACLELLFVKPAHIENLFELANSDDEGWGNPVPLIIFFILAWIEMNLLKIIIFLIQNLACNKLPKMLLRQYSTIILFFLL